MGQMMPSICDNGEELVSTRAGQRTGHVRPRGRRPIYMHYIEGRFLTRV